VNIITKIFLFENFKFPGFLFRIKASFHLSNLILLYCMKISRSTSKNREIKMPRKFPIQIGPWSPRFY